MPEQTNYVRFDDLGGCGGRKTHRWVVVHIRRCDVIGKIEWFAGLAEYAFEPEQNWAFEAGLLAEVASFIKKLNEELT